MSTIPRPHPRAWLERRRARAEADHWIGHGFASRYPWRVVELTAVRERRSDARAIRGVLKELSGTTLPGPLPLRVTALRPQTTLLEQIETRLLDEQPVSAAGMVAVNELLTSPGSCLFSEVDDVASCLRNVLTTLEVD